MTKQLKFIKFVTILILLTTYSLKSQSLKEEIEVITPIYTVVYSETKEQPISLIYLSTNREKNVSRESMDFYKEKNYHTSDAADYYKNPYDKGHLAPAATFSDSEENLKLTFSYLNCALQDKRLNRYLWKYLEAEEREWDNKQPLRVTIDIKFSDSIIPTGATLPSRFIKHILFTSDNQYRCFDFPNSSDLPKEKEFLGKYEVKHSH